jgi:hypothetical protein
VRVRLAVIAAGTSDSEAGPVAPRDLASAHFNAATCAEQPSGTVRGEQSNHREMNPVCCHHPASRTKGAIVIQSIAHARPLTDLEIMG